MDETRGVDILVKVGQGRVGEDVLSGHVLRVSSLYYIED